MLLLVVSVVTAPIGPAYRGAAVFTLILLVLGTTVSVLVESTSVFGATTRGTGIAVDYVIGALTLAMWLLVRQRHPLTILIAQLFYVVAGMIVLFSASPLAEPRIVTQGSPEAVVPIEAIVLRGSLITIGFVAIMIARLLDSVFWRRLPLGTWSADRDVDLDHGTSAESGEDRSDGDLTLMAWIAFWLMVVGLDLIAILLAFLATRPAPEGRLDAYPNFVATLAIGVGTAKFLLTVVVITGFIVATIDTTFIVP